MTLPLITAALAFVTMFIQFLTFGFVLASLASQADAGCQPQFAFLPPQYEHGSLSKGLDLIRGAIDSAVANGAFNTTSFSLDIASSKTGLLSIYHTANVTMTKGTAEVNGSSLYRIASNTKLFTALAILQQEAAGNINLDDAVSKYVAALPSNESVDWSGITIRALMAHRGGIINNFAQEDLVFLLPDPTALGLPPLSDAQLTALPKCEESTNYTIVCTKTELLEDLPLRPLVFPFRKQSSYSNVGYDILGLVLSNVTGVAYEDYISEHIFKPLGMDLSTFTTPPNSLSVVPDSSDFGVDLGVGNPSGGTYSSSSDMIRFLQYAIQAHNNITTTMDWFDPATYGPGSHSLIGHPWEIFRSSEILANNTREVTFNTKGGGLTGYYSYSVILPDYDLVVFMVTGGPDSDALAALNSLLNAVASPLAQAAEEVAQHGLHQDYAGNYTAAAAAQKDSDTYNPTANSSIEIAQSAGQNLYIKSWISNGTNALDNFIQVAGGLSGQGSDIFFQFIPTFETREGISGTVGEVWRFINVLKADGAPRNATNVWSDYCIGNIDPISYGQVPLNEAVFWRDNGTGQVAEIELSAFKIGLGRD